MDLFTWNDHFATGEPLIDREHRGLVTLINRVGNMQSSEASGQKVQEVLDELVNYASVHFRHEESLMADTGCDPGFEEAHIAAHRAFAAQIEQMYSPSIAKIDAEALICFLSSWLAYHILGMDQSLARQIRKIRSGATAARAYDDERRIAPDPATASLLNAVNTLYGIVVRRNKEWQELSGQLEGMVQVRSQELVERNRRLEEDIRRHEAAGPLLEAQTLEIQALQRRIRELERELLATPR